MNALDLWAFVALGVASGALYFRALMLRGQYKRWVNAPWPVWGSLMFAGIIAAGATYSILRGRHASGREAWVYTAWAVSSVVMLVNLWRQRPQESLVAEILAHVNPALLNAPREVLGLAIEAVRDVARRAGFHA